MEKAQIIIFSILMILWCIGLYKTLYSLKEETKSLNSIMLWILPQIFFIMFTFVSFIVINDLNKKVEGKCPEYEKLENVYKLK